MKHTITMIALASVCVGAALPANAADTDPFDFDYQIGGDLSERPALVFNDGRDTYLQPRAGQTLRAEGGHIAGPYIVVAGTPEVVNFSVGGKSASARWSRANQFIGGPAPIGAMRDDQPSGFDGFSNRLVLIGAHGRLESVRPLTATMPVSNLVKALVPQGWTGSAQKDIDLTGMRTFSTRGGENWMQAMDRLLSDIGLYADVNFISRHVRLTSTPAKSSAVNYAAGRQADGVPAATVSPATTPVVLTPAGTSLLASAFGAQAIRDGDDTHTQIRFTSKPVPELRVTSPDGASLHPKWDEATRVLTIDRAPRFLVSNGARGVEVARSAGTIYQFATPNAAHLETVFERDGATYFTFASSVLQVSVADAGHRGSGEQKGTTYRFNGIADQFVVTADGQVATVTRKHEVRYFDRAPMDAALGVSKDRLPLDADALAGGKS